MAAANPFKRIMDFFDAYDDDEDVEPMTPTSQAPTAAPTQAQKRQRGNLTLHNTPDGGMTIRHPQHMDDRLQAGEDMRRRRIVTLDLTRLSDTDARLFLEFVSGVAFALEADMKKVHDSIFLIIPRGIAIHNDVEDESAPLTETSSFTARTASSKVNLRADQEELFWQER